MKLIDRRILKCDYILFSPSETSTIITHNSQIYINIRKWDSVLCLLNSFFYFNSEFIKKADDSRYANGNDIRLINLGPIALFSIFKLTKISGKHLEGISHAHIVSLLYKLISSVKDSINLSIGLDHSRNRRRDKLTANKSVKGKNHLKFSLKNIFGSAEFQEKPT